MGRWLGFLLVIASLAACFGDNSLHEVVDAACGDGAVDPGEGCDDGNTAAGDGCSARCEVEAAQPVCGNGVRESGEACDDGNTTAGDGCSARCEVETANPVCGNAVRETGEACDDGNTTANDGCSATCTPEILLFSEYVEGLSNDKAVEIANLGTTPIALASAGCTIDVYFNGATSPSRSVSLDGGGTIAAGDVLVLCNSASTSAILDRCDFTADTAMVFNGNDAVVLDCFGDVVDVIGQIGVDPGTAWTASAKSTADSTLRRACAVETGDRNGIDAFDLTGWTDVDLDVSGLGDPACAN
ncbi:MAG TPA: DUF4215 domain-containing protein [Kofleriaceae bacterium]|nr:DUF4215 domain-containing protein [Kofleriaceae bacterium]